MLLRSMALGTVSLLLVAATKPHRDNAPVKVQLSVGTIHAAALTAPRSAADSLDHPFLLVSHVGPGATSEMSRLPSSSHFVIRNDQALGAQTLLSLSLQPGDSAQLLMTMLEGPDVRLSDEAEVAKASGAALRESGARRTEVLAGHLAPLVRQGAHWIGSMRVVIANEGGTLRWKQLECVATCSVVADPAAAEIRAAPVPPAGGVVELTGAKGTYHVNLRGLRLPDPA